MCSSWQRQRGDPQFAMTHVLGTATTAEAQVVPSLPVCEKGVAEEAHFRRVCSDLITEMGEHLGRTKGHRGLIFVFECLNLFKNNYCVGKGVIKLLESLFRIVNLLAHNERDRHDQLYEVG